MDGDNAMFWALCFCPALPRVPLPTNKKAAQDTPRPLKNLRIFQWPLRIKKEDIRSLFGVGCLLFTPKTAVSFGI
ncbi:hypothetical protein, partial [Paenibacillus qinlingensis]|uniref:hypothetical protein n=1 Tax=Paenibacillus qinlingensis TaxID=1837343 RepID=UPI00236883EB